MESRQAIMEKATGYFELGMFSDAWDLIEELPPAEKTDAPVLGLRLRILTALSQWELGEQIAAHLKFAGEDEKRTVARFHHARARVLWQSGDYDGARSEFRKAVEAWLDVREEFSDEDLNSLFTE